MSVESDLLQEILEQLKSGSDSSSGTPSPTRPSLGSRSTGGLTELKARKEQLDDLNKQEELRLKLLDRLTNAQTAYNDAVGRSADPAEMARVAAAVKEAGENLEGLNEGIKDFGAGTQAFESMADSVLGLSGPMESLSQVINGGRNSMLGFGTAMLEGVASGTLFIGMALKMVDSLAAFALHTDEVLANFRASTGAGNEFNSVIADTERATFAAGGTFEDAAASVGVLKNAFTDFTYLSKQQQNEITKTTVLLQKLGFEFSTQGEIFQIATQAMNMSAGDTEGLLLDLASTARSLGRDIDAVGQDFVQNADFLTRFGEDGVEVFEELAVSAKALGTDMGLLVKVMEGFQTFDEAGQAVGRLNAILGGPYLNAMDMLNASYEDPAEGIRMLRDGFDQAGRSIEDFTGAELMAIAAPMGLSLTETKELLGATNEELEIRRIKEEELAEQAAKTQSITEALNNAWKSMYINMEPLITNVFVPFIGVVSKFATGLSELMNTEAGFVGFMTTIGAVLGAGIGLMLAFTASIPVVGAAMAAFSFSQAVMYAGIGAAAGGLLGAGLGSLGTSKGIGGGGSSAKSTTPRFASGGVVQGTSVAMVGEQGPEMVEMPVGSRVTSAPATKELTDAIANLSRQLNTMNGAAAAPQQISVFIGQEKIDEIVVRGLNSNAARKAFGPYTNG
jgi:hypothetical protein